MQQALSSDVELSFVDRAGYGPDEDPQKTDFAEDERRVREALATGGHLVSHSYGAIAALMAAWSAPERVRSIALFEPACFSLARGLPEVEAHVRAMQPVLDESQALSEEEFLRQFLQAVGAPPSAEPLTEEGRLLIGRLRLQRGPWEAALEPSIIRSQPTVVITGGETPLYEEVAGRLVELGAEHITVEGFGHRPQDSQEANPILRALWART